MDSIALFNHPRDYGPGCSVQSHEIDTCEFYQPPPLPKGFDPATSVSGVQIAKLMTVALENYWSDIEPVLPRRFKSLVTNPVWYADPALYESQLPWYFEIPNRQYAGYDATKNEVLFEDVVHKICRADIIAALASLAEYRPRRIVEIMNGNANADLADIFFRRWCSRLPTLGKSIFRYQPTARMRTRHWRAGSAIVAPKNKSLARNHKTGCVRSGNASAPPSTALAAKPTSSDRTGL